MTDIIDEAQELEARHLESSLAAHAARATNSQRVVPTGECQNPECVEDFGADSAKLFCGPFCAERFAAISKHRNS
ncbi:hypothetical protein [Stenotrophomonas maltophilia]|uniref:hypothetical protein n=1 Tax=Stenotrophomonas maltophilia TaxID=40324 RepID=UPI002B1E76FF|nr:hypothetical protein [Stenotrophomonas maltophilia]